MVKKLRVVGFFSVLLILVLFTLIFIVGSATEVHALSECWSTFHTTGYFQVGSNMAYVPLWTGVHLEYLCNQKINKNDCLQCYQCSWIESGFPNTENKCHASSADFNCGMLLTQSECESSGGGTITYNCQWDSASGMCLFPGTNSSCLLNVINPGSPYSPYNYNCNYPGYGNSNYNYNAEASYHIGHDVFCDNRGYAGDRVYFTGVYAEGSCTKGAGYHNISPRTLNVNNCTCTSSSGGASIVSPLVCLATDYIFNYDCPPGYHLPTVQCCAGGQTVDMDEGYNQTCNDSFCSKQNLADCNSKYSNVCEQQTAGFCAAPNGNSGYDICSTKYDSSDCTETTYSGGTCFWTPIYDRCVKKAGATVTEGSCGGGCTFDDTKSFFQVENSAVVGLLRVDQTGNMWIKGSVKVLGSANYDSHAFLIKDSSGSVKAWVDASTGDLYLPEGISSVHFVSGQVGPLNSGNFVIQTHTESNRLWINASGLYLKGCLGVGKTF